MNIRDGATPYAHDGGPVGVLLVHGFTGSPASVRPLGRRLADAGHSVRAPRLPGHGTQWTDLERTRWQDWYAEVETAYEELAERCTHVVVVGLSTGGALVSLLAQRRPEVAGLVVINPVLRMHRAALALLPVARRVRRSAPGLPFDVKKTGVESTSDDRMSLKALHSQVQMWHHVTRDLPQITQPVLLFRSKVDHVVPASGADLFRSRISSSDLTETLLENSYHVATLDNDAPLIEQQTLEFVERVTR
ncbi:alpha/beta hydrolase [Calidifontibacter terrae]